MAKKLTQSFFEQPTLKVAEDLLGKFLVVQKKGNPRTQRAEQSPYDGNPRTQRAEQSPYDGKRIVGKIVETEAYIGEDDLACHASKGNPRTQRAEQSPYDGRTNRSEILYRKAGTVYVYLVYGMYYCLNIVTERENFPSAVLLRAVEPVEEIDLMKKRRKTNALRNPRTQRAEQSSYDGNLTSGPGKLCMAFGIDKELNGKTVFGKDIWIEDRGEDEPSNNIVSAPRVGVDYAKHCKNLPWRFYVKDNLFVSRK